MADRVKTGRRHHVGRKGLGPTRIDNSPIRQHGPGRDTRLGLHLQKIKNRDPRTLTARACGGGTRKVGSKSTGYRKTLPDWHIDIVHEITREGAVEIGGFGGIDHRSATDRDKAIKIAAAGKYGGILEGCVGWLYANLIVHNRLDTLMSQRINRFFKKRQGCHACVRVYRRPPDTEGPRFLPQFTQHPAAVADPGDIGRKYLLVTRYKLIVVAAVHDAAAPWMLPFRTSGTWRAPGRCPREYRRVSQGRQTCGSYPESPRHLPALLHLTGDVSSMPDG